MGIIYLITLYYTSKGGYSSLPYAPAHAGDAYSAPSLTESRRGFILEGSP